VAPSVGAAVSPNTADGEQEHARTSGAVPAYQVDTEPWLCGTNSPGNGAGLGGRRLPMTAAARGRRAMLGR
jgi:hypothetical protein